MKGREFYRRKIIASPVKCLVPKPQLGNVDGPEAPLRYNPELALGDLPLVPLKKNRPGTFSAGRIIVGIATRWNSFFRKISILE
ncbi:MAG TPA: hypothetical protein DDY22_02815 [Geobacter sp.]|nr:hypothetical protein [Geobacter sp.]